MKASPRKNALITFADLGAACYLARAMMGEGIDAKTALKKYGTVVRDKFAPPASDGELGEAAIMLSGLAMDARGDFADIPMFGGR
jgi:hypothetical protein